LRIVKSRNRAAPPSTPSWVPVAIAAWLTSNTVALIRRRTYVPAGRFGWSSSELASSNWSRSDGQTTSFEPIVVRSPSTARDGSEFNAAGAAWNRAVPGATTQSVICVSSTRTVTPVVSQSIPRRSVFFPADRWARNPRQPCSVSQCRPSPLHLAENVTFSTEPPQ
jgi:hypothetical protein